MDSVTYNVPTGLVDRYRGRQLILRGHDAAALLAAAQGVEHLVCIQLLSLPSEIEPLIQWREPIPVDLVMPNPARDFPLLYRYTALLDNHPVRVSLPVVAGFSKAVKLASALQFAVKLQVDQPGSDLIEELRQVLSLYLHQSTVSQPIDFFHGSLLAFLNDQPITLWAVQEEDPALFRYVTDQGEEALPRQSRGTWLKHGATGVDQLVGELLAEPGECARCEFLDPCGGYFKWPNRDFDCAGVKSLLGTLQAAAVELKRDLAATPTRGHNAP
jgi:hypothetical protein